MSATIQQGINSASSIGATVPEIEPAAFDRRHDLDALRAVAMLLGIVLHAALSFTTLPWSVKDSQQSSFYYVVFAGIHGFRMPLFFMVSGFFTAMLWRKRGLRSVLRQRFQRIFVPLLIGCFTIVPAMWAVGFVVSRPSPGAGVSSALFAAVADGDVDLVRVELRNSTNDINLLDASSGAPPLCTAVFLGHTQITALLVESGADVNLSTRERSTPLHIATFMGRASEAALLLKAGADVNAVDANQYKPRDLLRTDYGTTNFIASSLGVSIDEQSLLAGRKEIAGLLGETKYLGSGTEAGPAMNVEALNALLFQFPLFMHLWFLAFLCWLVIAFVLYAPLAKALMIEKLPSWLVCSPANLLVLLPLTMLPQSYMSQISFGPEPSIGLLPIPSVLGYYAIFFFFGAIYWDMDDRRGQLGRWWFISLPLSLLVVLPIALDLQSGTLGLFAKFDDPSINALAVNFLQAAFAWLMSFGSIGIFRQLLSRENRTMRYISDSSYWLYLAHLPLVLLGQWIVKDMNMPALLKFVGVVSLTSALLLISYEYGVRYKWIGRLLNGPRTRRSLGSPQGTESLLRPE